MAGCNEERGSGGNEGGLHDVSGVLYNFAFREIECDGSRLPLYIKLYELRSTYKLCSN